MTIIKKKLRKRLYLITISGLKSLIVRGSNILISIFVIRAHSVDLWGSFIFYLILFDLGLLVVSWGSNPYLLREYSLYPQKISTKWQEAALYRLMLLIAFLIIYALLNLPHEVKTAFIFYGFFKYFHQTFDSLIQYQRNFLFSAIIETTGLLIIVGTIFFFTSSLSVSILVYSFSLSFAIKAISYTVFYFKTIFKKFDQPLFKLKRIGDYYKTCFPFFLLSVGGMLESRADLYIVAFFLSKSQLGEYQIILNFLNLTMFFGSLILSPFSKNIFRLSPNSLYRLERQFKLIGIIFSLIAILFMYLIITFIYKIEGPLIWYGMGYLSVVPFFFYLLRNYELGKVNKQMIAAQFDFLGSLIKIIGSVILTPLFMISGALTSGVISKVFLAFIYNKKVNFS